MIIYWLWLKKISAELGKLDQKRILYSKLTFFKPNLSSEDDAVGRKQVSVSSFSFPLLFKNVIVFTVAILEWVKPEPHKLGIQMLILAIFGIAVLLKRVKKH